MTLIIYICPSVQTLETVKRRLLHALPLHHIHGAVVAMHAPHAAGACVEFLPKFSPAAVWDRLMVRLPSSQTAHSPTWSLLLKHMVAGRLVTLHIDCAGAAC